MMRLLVLGFGTLCILFGQSPPLRVEFQCTEEDIQWAGMSCTEDDPCPIYLELSAVESVGNRIFAAGNLHSDSTTLYSVLLGSDDAGKSWQELHPRIRGSSLDHIQFADLETGWISGELLFPLPRDPFFLLTTDGGKTWRNRPVFDEPRAGSIQQFWFSSRTEGSVVIGRELYESPNGGESWTIREVSDRVPHMKRASTGDPIWRIRADAKTKSFHIEKRQGERWSGIASFLIPAGSCSPPKDH